MSFALALLWSSVPLTLAVSRHLWPWRRSASVRLIYAVFVGTTGWCVAYSFEILAQSESAKLLWAMAQYPFMGVLPVAWLGLALTLWRHGRPPPRAVLWALAVVPVLVQPLVWTNELHHLVWRSHGIRTLGELRLLGVEHGPAFWAFNLYCLAAIGIGLLVLVGLALTNRTLSAAQRLSMLLAAALPALCNMIYTLELGPLPGLDLTPFAFALSAIAAGHVTYGAGFLNIVLMARDMVLEQMPQAVFVLDRSGAVVDANRSARSLCAGSGGYRRGADIASLLPFMPAGWESRLDARESIPVESGEGASRRCHRLDGMLLHRDDGALAGRVVIVTDTTAEELARRQLDEARDAAEAASRAKIRFLANMSHEIRTPLNAVLGMAQLLQETTGDRTARRYADTIIESGETLMTILGDILDVAEAESGALRLQLRSLDLRALFEELRQQFDAPARDKGLALELEVAASVPARLFGDAARVRQILGKLVDNAVKFTPAGRVAVRAQWVDERKPAEGGRLRLVVSDTGIGIAPANLQKIFGPFEQVDSSDSRAYGGTGLGLAIVRQLTELMQGRVLVESEPGRGSTFTVELPLRPAQPPAAVSSTA